MSNQLLFIIMGISGGLFLITIIGYFAISKTLGKSDAHRIKQLREGTQGGKLDSDVLYQKLYTIFIKTPLLKRYANKLRRQLEIINIEDEYLTRKQTAKIMLRSLLIVTLLTVGIFLLASSDKFLLSVLILYEFFFIETLMSGMVDKLDTKLLKQQVEFFAKIRHAYHEFKMVEEAIYEVSQNDELEVSRQGEKIYEILISDDPEMELEKYYDIAPNSYLKEFAGVSYLTREFGDRTDKDGASLYLKNLNNITEEMQLEILKREKLDYVFQSLSVIAVVPVLAMQPLKSWAVSNFSFTSSFYDGKLGFIAQILIIILTFVCYILTRKLKDNGSMRGSYVDPNKVWQMKVYNNPVIKPFIDMFIPKEKTKDYRKNIVLLKDAASKQKIETLYVNRIVYAILVFIGTLLLCIQIHNVAIDYVYENPTSKYDLLGGLSEKALKTAMELTRQDNYFLDKLRAKKIKKEKLKDVIRAEVKASEFYKEANEEEIEEAVTRLEEKYNIVNKENLKWFEWLIAFAFAIARILCTNFAFNIPKIYEKIRNRKRGNAISNNYFNAYEN